MTGFLGEIGKKLAERWVALLALPGLLYIAVGTAAHVLGWSHALDLGHLNRQITAWAKDPAIRAVGGLVLVIVAVLAGSVLTALAATALGEVVSAWWTATGRRRPASWLVAWRRQRSQQAKEQADNAESKEEIERAMARADRICMIDADRPTWIGDRLRACRVRVERAYGLDLDTIWPRLWALLPDPVRTDLIAARDSYAGAARLYGWAVLYAVLTVWWWPAALIAVCVAVTAQTKARRATDLLADLVEAAVDLHASDLATRLGHPSLDGRLTPADGQKITARMRKSRWDPDSPLAD